MSIYNKTSIKRNILTIKQNTLGSRSGYGLISTPVRVDEKLIFFPIRPHFYNARSQKNI